MLVWHWSHPSTPAGVGWDLTIDNAIALVTEKGIAARAALGEAEIIRLIVDDPTGTREYKKLHRIYAVEDETPGDLLVWNGYISDQWEDVGEEGDFVYPFSTGRRWELEVTQENTLLAFRVIRSGGDRKAESPGARLRWVLNSDFLKTVYDHGLIDWTTLDAYADMTPSNYTDQTAADVLRSISHWTGYNHYLRYRDASSDIELAFYNPNTNITLDLSSLKISGDSADLAFNADGSANFASTLVWPPSFGSTRLHRKGDRVAAGVLVRAANNISSYDYSLPTSYEFGFQDIVVTDNTVTTQAGADRLRDRLLKQHESQDERIHTRIHVPAANLNSVMHGQLIEAKFPRFTDWATYRKCRVVSKSFSRPDNESQAVYDVDLELSPLIQGVEPFLVLYRPQTGTGGTPSPKTIGWICSGDPQPCSISQYGVLPTVGPLATIAGSAPGRPDTQYLGASISGTGTIDIESHFWVEGAAAGWTNTVNLLLNGVTFASGSVLSPGHNINVNATGVAVAPGDEITAQFVTGNNDFYIDGLLSQFKITGGSLVA